MRKLPLAALKKTPLNLGIAAPKLGARPSPRQFLITPVRCGGAPGRFFRAARSRFLIFSFCYVLLSAFLWSPPVKSAAPSTVGGVRTTVSFVKKKWVVKLKQNSYFNRKPFQFSKPLVDGDKIFVGVQNNLFYGINTKRGKKLWTFKTQGPVFSKAVVQGEFVFFPDAKGTIYALNKESGKLAWISRVDGEVLSAPLILGDKIYIVTLDKELAQIDMSNGNVLWQTSQTLRERGFSVVGAADPILVDGKILVGFSNGSLVAFHPANGDVHWARQLGDPSAEFHDVDATLLLAGKYAYVSSADGKLFALDPKTGQSVWEAPFGDVNNATISGDILYVTAAGTVYAVRAETGETIWEQNLDIPGVSSPVVYDKWLSVVATKGKIYFLDKSKGDVLYGYYVKGGSYSDPIMDENRLYILSNASRLYAFQYK